MQIRQVAEELGCPPDTLRHYIRIGLISPEKQPGNGYHSFSEYDLRQTQFVLNARKLGFSIEDVRHFQTLSRSGESPCVSVRQKIELRLDEVKKQISSLTALRDSMESALTLWQTMPNQSKGEGPVCHLIESFGGSKGGRRNG